LFQTNISISLNKHKNYLTEKTYFIQNTFYLGITAIPSTKATTLAVGLSVPIFFPTAETTAKKGFPLLSLMHSTFLIIDYQS
jgi:hypothetical protein